MHIQTLARWNHEPGSDDRRHTLYPLHAVSMDTRCLQAAADRRYRRRLAAMRPSSWHGLAPIEHVQLHRMLRECERIRVQEWTGRSRLSERDVARYVRRLTWCPPMSQDDREHASRVRAQDRAVARTLRTGRAHAPTDPRLTLIRAERKLAKRDARAAVAS